MTSTPSPTLSPPPKYLLLLPRPSSTSANSISALVSGPLRTALHAISTSSAELYVASPTPFSTRARRASFAAAARLLAALYSAVHGASTALGGKTGVDVRVVLLARSAEEVGAKVGATGGQGNGNKGAKNANGGVRVEEVEEVEEEDQMLGPVVGLRQLLGAHDWARVWYATARPDTGLDMKRRMLSWGHAAGRLQVIAAPSSSSVSHFGDGGAGAVDPRLLGIDYRVVAVGGSFDQLHLGHKLLLTCVAYLLAPPECKLHMVVGVTGDALLRARTASPSAASTPSSMSSSSPSFYTYAPSPSASTMPTPWHTRVEQVAEFVRAITLPQADVQSPQTMDGRMYYVLRGLRQTLYLEVASLDDPFGPTITLAGLQALVMSEETRNGGELVNRKRVDKGWDPVDICTVALVTPDGAETMATAAELQKKKIGQWCTSGMAAVLDD